MFADISDEEFRNTGWVYVPRLRLAASTPELQAVHSWAEYLDLGSRTMGIWARDSGLGTQAEEQS